MDALQKSFNKNFLRTERPKRIFGHLWLAVLRTIKNKFSTAWLKIQSSNELDEKTKQNAFGHLQTLQDSVSKLRYVESFFKDIFVHNGIFFNQFQKKKIISAELQHASIILLV